MATHCQCAKKDGILCNRIASTKVEDDPRYCWQHQKCQQKTNISLPKPVSVPIQGELGKKRKPEMNSKDNYFVSTSDLPENKKKWCRCILHVAAKQTDQCLEDVVKNSGKSFNGNKCYNVYAVCAKNIGTTSRKCSQNYNFNNIPDNELIAYAKIHKISVPKPYDRIKMIESIM